MENHNKEVLYSEYCFKCKNANLDETEDPCNECLTTFYNFESSKPINFDGVEES